MADDSDEYNVSEEYDEEEDARSDVTYFELDGVEEVTEVEVEEPQKQRSTQKRNSLNQTEDDDAVSDITTFSDEPPKIEGIEPTENSCRLCLLECKDDADEMAKYTDIYTYCTAYTIYANDIPKKLCNNCKNTLNQLYDFKKKCKRTEYIISELSKKMDYEIDFEEPVADQETESPLTKASEVKFDLEDPAVKAQIQSCYQKRPLGRPRKNPSELAKPYPIPGRPCGRPRVEKPLVPKRPIGRPRGTTKPKPPFDLPKRKAGRPEGIPQVYKNPPTKRIGRPPGSKNKDKRSLDDTEPIDSDQYNSANDSYSTSRRSKAPDESIGEGLDVLRGDLPSEKKWKKRGPRPDVQKYPACDDRILCPKCGRVFLESERKNMYNHMHKHRVEERRAAEEKKQLKLEIVEQQQQSDDHTQPTKVEYIVVGRGQAHSSPVEPQQIVQQSQSHMIYRTHWN